MPKGRDYTRDAEQQGEKVEKGFSRHNLFILSRSTYDKSRTATTSQKRDKSTEQQTRGKPFHARKKTTYTSVATPPPGTSFRLHTEDCTRQRKNVQQFSKNSSPTAWNGIRQSNTPPYGKRVHQESASSNRFQQRINGKTSGSARGPRVRRTSWARSGEGRPRGGCGRRP